MPPKPAAIIYFFIEKFFVPLSRCHSNFTLVNLSLVFLCLASGCLICAILVNNQKKFITVLKEIYRLLVKFTWKLLFARGTTERNISKAIMPNHWAVAWANLSHSDNGHTKFWNITRAPLSILYDSTNSSNSTITEENLLENKCN